MKDDLDANAEDHEFTYHERLKLRAVAENNDKLNDLLKLDLDDEHDEFDIDIEP